MFNLAKCPACGQFAVGRPDWPTDQPVRCPHCLTEFVLSSTATQSVPRLIPIEAIEGATPEVPDEAIIRPDVAPSAIDPTTEHPPAVEPDEPAAAAPLADRSDKPAKPLPPAYAEAYDFLPEEKQRQIDTAAVVASRLRLRDKKKRSYLGELFKIILGAILGLAIGYWALNFFRGEACDWLKVYLPGCSHTNEHWPAEHLPWTPNKQSEPAKPREPAEAEPSRESIEPADRSDFTRPTVPKDSTDVPKLPGLDEPRPVPPSNDDRQPEPAPAKNAAPSLESESTVRLNEPGFADKETKDEPPK